MTDGEGIQKVASSIYQVPGAYALLLGSGVSRSAQIPTAWGIVSNLIDRLAISRERRIPEDRAKWYSDAYHGEEPTYSNLLNKVTSTPAERSLLLKSYFEASPEEIELGIKLPSAAHKAIAKLVKLGYIRLIITTNFDRLIENALIEEGIIPNVIRSDADFLDKLPYVHLKDSCTVVKLNGDYIDLKTRNLPHELAEYPDETEKYLDRVFDDFGLIVCGWSAEHDKALREALGRRRQNHPFAAYWTCNGELKPKAKEVIATINANVIQITGADDFFVDLCETIKALRQFRKDDVLTREIAIERTRNLIIQRNHVRLHQLISKETNRVCELLSSDEFEVDTAKLSKLSVARLDEQFIHNRIKRYEEIIGPLCGILTTLVWFDDEGRYSKTIPKVIEQATIEHNFTSASSHLRDLQFYPGLLLFYSTCITALERRNYKVLSEIVRNSRVSTRHERAYAIHRLSGMKIFENISLEILNLNEVEKSDSEEDYVYKVVHSYAHNYLPESKMFRELQTLFEFIVALISIDLATLDTNYLAHHRVEWFNRQCSLINTLNSPIPELVERLNGSRMKLSPLHDFFSEADMYQEEWDFLKHGLFRGSYERFNECYFKFLQIRF